MELICKNKHVKGFCKSDVELFSLGREIVDIRFKKPINILNKCQLIKSHIYPNEWRISFVEHGIKVLPLHSSHGKNSKAVYVLWKDIEKINFKEELGV